MERGLLHPSPRCRALHLPSFWGIVSQWASFVTIDLLHADTRAVFLWPSPIFTVGKQLNPSPNQCSLFNLSYWLACPSIGSSGWKNTNKLDGWKRTTEMVAQTMKSHIFNNELWATGGKKVTEWRIEEAREEGKKRGEKQRKNGSIWADNHQASVPMCEECDIAEVGTAGKRSMGCFLLICNP